MEAGDTSWWSGSRVRAAVVAAFAAAAMTRAWLADDGLIYVRVVEMTLAGDGPTFNGAVRAESATGPLWVVVLAALGVLLPVAVDVLAVWAGLGCAVAGVALACTAATPPAGSAVTRSGLVPLGVVAYALYPPAWDFATSGLESGLTLLWSGGIALLLRTRDRTDARFAVLVGLGPLIRPDFAIVAAVVLVACLSSLDRWALAKRLAAAVALPVAYELFRAGWYGALVPTAATAKEGLRLRPDQGAEYLWHSLVPFGTPIVALAIAGVRRTSGSVVPSRAALFAVAGSAHLAYVAAVGGDFMRGRLVLPGLIWLAIAAGSAKLPSRVTGRTGLSWAALSVSLLIGVVRLDVDGTAEVGDARADAVSTAGSDLPASVGAYGGSDLAATARLIAERAPVDSLVLVGDASGEPPTEIVPLRDDVAVRVDLVVVLPPLGVFSAYSATDTVVLDVYGLADPIAAHQRLDRRGLPGHEKPMAYEWYVARFGDPDAPVPASLDADDVEAARRALRCGRLADLVDAVSDPMSVDRFLTNLRLSPVLTTFRFDPDPLTAEREVCSPSDE